MSRLHLTFLCVVCMASTATYARSLNASRSQGSHEILRFPIDRPQRKFCLLGKLAKAQSSVVSFLDILLLYSPNSKKFGKCPTINELTKTNNYEITPRVFGGSTSREGQWPWMALVFEVDSCRTLCGGTLLNNYWVLSAAHCFESIRPSIYGVVLGENRISVPTPKEMFRLLKEIIRHPQYDSLPFNNDVALLKLSKPVHFTEFVRPACLPPSGTPTDQLEGQSLIGDSSCTAMGWGKTGPNQATADVLMDIPLNIIPNTLCYTETIKTSRLRAPVLSFETKFCGGGNPFVDTCRGDSGGPVICSLNGTYSVIGVTSYGPTPCGQEREFGVYAKVADPRINNWIRKSIALPRLISRF